MNRNPTWAAARVEIAGAFGVDLVALDKAVTASVAGGSLPVAGGSRQQAAILPSIGLPDLGRLGASTPFAPLRIEETLEGALDLTQLLRHLIEQYRDTASRYLEAHLRMQEFWATEMIHEEEKRAGLYELPYEEAERQRAGLAAEIGQSEQLAARLTAMIGDQGLLGDAAISATVERDAVMALAAVRQASPDYKTKYVGRTRTSSERRLKLDQDMVRNALDAVRADMARARGDLAGLERRVNYLKQDIGFKRGRADVAFRTGYMHLLEHVRDGSPLNYPEILKRLKAHIGEAVLALHARYLAVSQGLKALYGVDLPLTAAEGDDIEVLLTWFTRARQSLAVARAGEVVRPYAIWLSRRNVSVPLPQGGAVLSISTADTGGVAGRLRGLSLERIGTSVYPSQIDLTPPLKAFSRTSPGATTLHFPRILAPGREDLSPSHADTVWNGSPYGEWRFKAVNAAQATDFALVLWIAT